MVALTDLAPSTRTVRVQGADLNVYGVSALGVASLLTRFPDLASLFTGDVKFDLTFDTVLKLGPDVVAHIIAAGCGSPGDEKAVAVAANLPVGDQAALLRPIIELTIPEGPGPLLDALNAVVGGKLESENLGKAPDSK